VARRRVNGALVGKLLLLWRRSVKIQVRGLEQLERHPTAVLATWHGRMQGPVFCVAGRGLLTMVSRSFDGDVAAQAIAALGLVAARGSTGRGGVEALDELGQWLEDGRARLAGLTVDGPRGPMTEVKRGAVDLARRVRAPIIPCSFSARPHLRLRSWDRMVIALPLSRMLVAFDQPFEVAADEPTPAACARLKLVLDRLTESLDRELHGRPLWPQPSTIIGS